MFMIHVLLGGQFLVEASRIMKEKGISRAELAERIDEPLAHINNLFDGGGDLTVAAMQKISRALGIPIKLQLGESTANSPTTVSDEPSKAVEPTRVDNRQSHEAAAAKHELELDAEARKVVAETHPEVLAKIIRLIEKPRKRPGRPKGAGVIDDSARLDQMADLIVTKKARSERQAALMIAEEEPGQSVSSTDRRLRNKFSKNRKSLLAAARARLKARELPDRTGTRQRKTYTPRPPIINTKRGADFLAKLLEQQLVSREIAEQLRMPFMLETIAQIASAVREHVEQVQAVTNAFLNPAAVDQMRQMRQAAAQIIIEGQKLAELLPLDSLAEAIEEATMASRMNEHIAEIKRFNDLASPDPFGESEQQRKIRRLTSPAPTPPGSSGESEQQRKIRRLTSPAPTPPGSSGESEQQRKIRRLTSPDPNPRSGDKSEDDDA